MRRPVDHRLTTKNPREARVPHSSHGAVPCEGWEPTVFRFRILAREQALSVSNVPAVRSAAASQTSQAERVRSFLLFLCALRKELEENQANRAVNAIYTRKWTCSSPLLHAARVR